MDTKNFVDQTQQSRLMLSRLSALFVFSIRLPYWRLSHCFKYTSSCYTPEKPGVNPAFRGSTYSWTDRETT